MLQNGETDYGGKTRRNQAAWLFGRTEQSGRIAAVGKRIGLLHFRWRCACKLREPATHPIPILIYC